MKFLIKLHFDSCLRHITPQLTDQTNCSGFNVDAAQKDL